MKINFFIDPKDLQKLLAGQRIPITISSMSGVCISVRPGEFELDTTTTPHQLKLFDQPNLSPELGEIKELHCLTCGPMTHVFGQTQGTTRRDPSVHHHWKCTKCRQIINVD